MMSGIILLLLYTASFWPVSSATQICNVELKTSSCNYTIICDNFAGQASSPTCSSVPHVTFLIRNSNVQFLTAGFFGATNFDARINVIQAVDNRWPTLEESCVRYYIHTTEIDFSNNRIETIKDYAFKNLHALEVMNLSSNFIETLSASTLLAASQVSYLRTLDLSHNRISSITNAFKYLSKLQKLYLNNNNIIHIEDSEFSGLSGLVNLKLDHNKLISINMTLVNLKLLQNLDLGFNDINNISGYELNRLTALKNLNISNNNIKSLESNCFYQAFDLRSVDFSHNKIETELENVMFINNALLMYVNFENNSITKIEENVFKHNSISYLNLKFNHIEAEINQSTFKGLENITNLDLSGQRFSSINENALSGMINLLRLNLSSNQISIVNNSSFSSSQILNILDLSHNNISDVSFFKYSLPNITVISLKNNNIYKIEQGLFTNHQFLQYLDISMNNIVEVEPLSLPLNSLQYLYLAGNQFNGPIKKDVFSPAKFLRFLDLYNFNITKIEKQAFINMPVLVRLNISHNLIDEIDPDNFKFVGNMINLDISYNNLTKFAFNNSSLGGTQAIYLNNNKLNIFPSANVSEVVYLDLSNNEISNVSLPIFKSFKHLRVLHLSNNKLDSFSNPFTLTLRGLSDLSLSFNRISSLNLSPYKNLETLDIRNNSLSSIDKTFFKNMDFLQSIDLSCNNVSVIPPGTFKNLIVLKMLNMSSNKLTSMRYGALKGLDTVEVIDLSRNEIAQIDVHVFHECVKMTRLILDYNQLKEIDIEMLITLTPSLTSVSIGGNSIQCKEIVLSIKNITNKNLTKDSPRRQVEVTSIDKIYHEDNVNGIQCGKFDMAKPNVEHKIAVNEESVSGFVILISVLVTILIIAIVGSMVYTYKLKLRNRIYTESRLQMRNSVNASLPDFQGDLLN